MDEGEEARCELVIAHGDAAELLELEEEGFHKMALLVKPPIDVRLLPARSTSISRQSMVRTRKSAVKSSSICSSPRKRLRPRSLPRNPLMIT